MHAGMLAEEPEIVLQFVEVLPPADPPADLFIERLNADLELQRSGRELRNDLSQSVRQPIWNNLEVKEEAGLIAFQEKLEERLAGVQVQIEGAIHKLELLHPAV